MKTATINTFLLTVFLNLPPIEIMYFLLAVNLRKKPIKMNLHWRFMIWTHIFVSSGAYTLRTKWPLPREIIVVLVYPVYTRMRLIGYYPYSSGYIIFYPYPTCLTWVWIWIMGSNTQRQAWVSFARSVISGCHKSLIRTQGRFDEEVQT